MDELNLKALRESLEWVLKVGSPYACHMARFILDQIKSVEECQCDTSPSWDCFTAHESLRADLLKLQREVL